MQAMLTHYHFCHWRVILWRKIEQESVFCVQTAVRMIGHRYRKGRCRCKGFFLLQNHDRHEVRSLQFCYALVGLLISGVRIKRR